MNDAPVPPPDPGGEHPDESDAIDAILDTTKISSLLLRGGSISVGILAVIVLLRLIAVSGWSWHTAAAVAETIEISDVTTIGLGTVFEQPILSGIIVAVIVPFAMIRLIRRIRGGVEAAIAPALVLVAASMTGLMLIMSRHQWWLPVISVAGLVGLVVGERMVAQDVWQPRIRLTVHLLMAVMVSISLVLAAVVPTPWVPREHIVTTQGEFAGYVLETEAGFLKVLVREDHELLIIPTSEVLSRQVHE